MAGEKIVDQSLCIGAFSVRKKGILTECGGRMCLTSHL